MSIAGVNTLHTTCEGERTQLLTIFSGFLLNPNLSNFFYVEGSIALPGSMIVLIPSPLYT